MEISHAQELERNGLPGSFEDSIVEVSEVVEATAPPVQASTLRPISDMQYHPTSEKLVDILCDHTQSNDRVFFRVMVAYYLSLAATQMRCAIRMLDDTIIPVNMFALNLAPSGYGKTMAMTFLEEKVLGQFRTRFMEDTFLTLAKQNFPKLALKRAIRNGTDAANEEAFLVKAFDKMGELPFSFNKATAPAVEQARNKLLMANTGSLNLVMDEVGANLLANMEMFDIFIELYDKGITKNKLLKSTNDNIRMEEFLGQTPTNLLMFGVATRLLDADKTEKALMDMLDMGYARRCFFGFVRDNTLKFQQEGKTTRQIAEEMLDATVNNDNVADTEAIADQFYRLADIINTEKRLTISRETCIMLNEYRLHCQARSVQFRREKDEILRREMSERNFKVLKLAGAYAFADDSASVTNAHVEAAIRLAEDSGEAFKAILTRESPWIKLAKFIGSSNEEVNQADLAEELSFYKGSASAKQDLMNQAIGWGYKNNIVIKKIFADGIEYFKGETLRPTDLSQMVVSYSEHEAYNYRNERPAFDQLHKLTQAEGMHWCAHHVLDGHRDDMHCIPGFNVAVVDIDGAVSMSTAKLLLKDYKWLMYTTKRHTDQENRFRILLPLNYELKLDAKDYKEFMKNLFEWLPFEVVDTAAGISKKWLSHDGEFEYNEGELLDALPFIPKTSKNEERKKTLNDQQSMDNLERWVMNNTGDGNRNNMLLRYGMILLDAGFDFEDIRARVFSLNDKMKDKLDEIEIMSTIMRSVGKSLSRRA